MEVINLSTQLLTEIPKWVFDPSSQVQVLNLTFNRLFPLPPEP